MEQIVIQVRSKEKAKFLYELLRSLDFVDVISSEGSKVTEITSDEDFFALAGIWEGRDIDLASIRKQAWPRQ
ncbi:MAG: hypothetical protein M5U34_43205 [Chloroflexi bacterium]|nr:hypothetical protein [Chloroflexota bacterium]